MARPKKGQLSQREVCFEALPACIEKESGGGKHRFGERALFYALRKIILERCPVTTVNTSTIGAIIADYENEFGKIPLKYNEPRGKLYHPHVRSEIPLGTIAVERYVRPEWTFNKILYIEKAGMFPTLIDMRWPERRDCALLSSQGHATGAVCDVIDLLADSDEEITVFCVHDADGYGTCIYQALQEGARSRPARKVKIINLGLEAAEAVAMGLPIEPVERKKGAVPVARYVDREWAKWYQTRRIELNAMTTNGFVSWLDGKVAEHDKGKVIPPGDWLAREVESHVRSAIHSHIDRTIVCTCECDCNVYERRDEALEDALEQMVVPPADDLRKDVAEFLERDPVSRWTWATQRIADGIANEVEIRVPRDES